MKKNKNSVEIEAFLLNAKHSHKHIRIPWRTMESKPYFKFIKKLLKQKLITKTTYNDAYEERMSMTLDNKLYKDYQKCLRLLGNNGLMIKPPVKD